MSILQGLDPQAIAEHFGEVDTEYTWLQEPQTMTHSDEVAQLRARIADLERNSVIRTDNGAVILALEKRIKELESDYNEMSLQNEHIVKENGVNVERIAELERERDTAKTNALTCLRMMEQAQNECEALRGDKKTFPIATHNGLHIYSDADAVERKIISLEAELSAAIADARALATLLKEVDDANPTMAYSVKAYWVMKKYLQP